MARIDTQDRIPLTQKVAFALGEKTAFVAITLTTSVMWLPYFNIGLGLSPVVLGLILMIWRAWDAISDPLMGHLSDITRTRWGRRRPYIFLGAITTGLLFPLIWNFPHSVEQGESWLATAANWVPFIDHFGLTASEKAMSLYLVIVGLLFFTSYTMWSMPYYGLQLELTPDYDERTRLTAFMAFVGKVTALVTSWTFAIVVFMGTLALGDTKALAGQPGWLRTPLEWLLPWLQSFGAEHSDEKPVVVGMRMLCWVFAAGIIILGMTPALFVKERYYKKEAKHEPREPFWHSIGESLRCKPLWSLIMASFFLVVGYASIGGLGQYMNIYYVCGGDLAMASKIAGVKGTILTISGIAMLPVFTWLGERFDKRSVVFAMLMAGITGHMLNYVLMTPDYPYLQVITASFEACALSAIWMFLPSMKADVADWDELKTSRRREGNINAFYSWFLKAAYTCSMGLSGYVLQMTGFSSKLGQQPSDVLHRMFINFLIIPALLWLVSAAAIWLYPLSRKASAEIRGALEARRGRL